MRKYINHTRGAHRTFTEARESERLKAAFRDLPGPLLIIIMDMCMCAAAPEGRGQGTSCTVDPPRDNTVTHLKMSDESKERDILFERASKKPGTRETPRNPQGCPQLRP